MDIALRYIELLLHKVLFLQNLNNHEKNTSPFIHASFNGLLASSLFQ